MATLEFTLVKSFGVPPAERMHTKTHGVQAVCKAAPVRNEAGGKYKCGGMWRQLRKLMRRIHPKTAEVMKEHRNQDGSLWGRGLSSIPTSSLQLYVSHLRKVFTRMYLSHNRNSPRLLKEWFRRPLKLEGKGSVKKRRAKPTWPRPAAPG